jgi:hypothetical protein
MTGAKVTDQMIGDWAKPFSETGAKNVTSDIYTGAKRWIATLDPGGQKLADYQSGLISSLGFIQIMGMAKPRKLDNIYVGLRTLPNLKKYMQKIRYFKWKPEEEKVIVDARKFLYGRESFNIDKFISELGYSDIESSDSSRIEEEEDDLNPGAMLEYDAGINAPSDRSIQAIEFVSVCPETY